MIPIYKSENERNQIWEVYIVIFSSPVGGRGTYLVISFSLGIQFFPEPNDSVVSGLDLPQVHSMSKTVINLLRLDWGARGFRGELLLLPVNGNPV